MAVKWIATMILGTAGAASLTYSVSGPRESLHSTASMIDMSGTEPDSPIAHEVPSLSEEQPAIAAPAPEPEVKPPAKKMQVPQMTIKARAPATGASIPSPPPSASKLLDERSQPKPTIAPQAVNTEFDSIGRRWVRVYFATDRNRLDLNGSWVYVQLWLPVTAGFLVSLLLLFGILAGVRRSLATVGMIAGLIVTSYFAHKAVIGTQYVRMLAESSQVAFDSKRYTSRAGSYPLHLGVSDVTLPPDHDPGKLERPSLLKMEWKEDDTKHVALQSVQIMQSQAFFDDLKQSGKESALIFIHGYNVRFDDALRRTAQISADLEYHGIPILYSWPSYGKTILYSRDENNVSWTVPHLETFLLDLKAQSGVQQIHVIAHSMGNRALLGVVERLGLRGNVGKALSRVVMAAPDVDSSEFHDRFCGFLGKVSQATVIYGSKNDRALLLSESIHGNDRLGLVSNAMFSDDCVDMIDTTPLDMSMLGHSYYGSNPVVMGDMKAFLSNQYLAKNRPWLQAENLLTPGRVVWRFVPTAASLFTNRR